MRAEGWHLRERPVSPRDKLSAIAELTGKEPGELTRNCGPAGLIAYSCSRFPCRVPVCSTKIEGVKVTPRVKPPPGPASFAAMLASLLKRDPKSPETLGVRGEGSVNDAVLLESNGALHLGPALRRPPSYRVWIFFSIRISQGVPSRRSPIEFSTMDRANR